MTVTPFGQASREVTGDFINTPEFAFAHIAGNHPVLRLTTVDASGIRNGDPVVVSGNVYTVTRCARDDEAGDVVLSLNAAA